MDFVDDIEGRKYTGTVPLRRLKLITTAEHASLRLDELLAHWLTSVLERPVSKAKVRKLIVVRAVRLNGGTVSFASQGVSPRMKIEADIDIEKLFGDSTSRDKPFELTADRILFEDEDLIAVEKPPGLPAQPTVDAARDSLFTAVSRFLRQRDGNTTPYVGVHQRLDRDTSGVVLFTKSRRVNAAVAEIFSKHLGIKSYQAITGPRRKTGSLKKDWTIKNYLGRVASRSKRSKYGAVAAGEFAETAFHVLGEYPRGMWIAATPKTGRTHQIRVHLSEMGLPILGDDLYGEAALAPRLMLHATELVFPHPITGREISVKSPAPEDFSKCLQQIRDSG